MPVLLNVIVFVVFAVILISALPLNPTPLMDLVVSKIVADAALPVVF